MTERTILAMECLEPRRLLSAQVPLGPIVSAPASTPSETAAIVFRPISSEPQNYSLVLIDYRSVVYVTGVVDLGTSEYAFGRGETSLHWTLDSGSVDLISIVPRPNTPSSSSVFSVPQSHPAGTPVAPHEAQPDAHAHSGASVPAPPMTRSNVNPVPVARMLDDHPPDSHAAQVAASVTAAPSAAAATPTRSDPPANRSLATSRSFLLNSTSVEVSPNSYDTTARARAAAHLLPSAVPSIGSDSRDSTALTVARAIALTPGPVFARGMAARARESAAPPPTPETDARLPMRDRAVTSRSTAPTHADSHATIETSDRGALLDDDRARRLAASMSIVATTSRSRQAVSRAVAAVAAVNAKISTARKGIVYLLLAVLLFGHLFDVATSKEHWPFSPYPMYATVQKDWTLKVMRLVGVTDTNPPREITFNATYLRNTLNSLQNGGPSRRPRMIKAVRDFLVSYNKGRVYASQEYPRLRAIRLYEYVWNLRTDPPQHALDRPDSRRLLFQVKTDQPPSNLAAATTTQPAPAKSKTPTTRAKPTKTPPAKVADVKR